MLMQNHEGSMHISSLFENDAPDRRIKPSKGVRIRKASIRTGISVMPERSSPMENKKEKATRAAKP